MDEMMYAPVFAGEGKMVYEERPAPRPAAPDDVIVAVKACGICGTDLNILAVPPAHKALPGIVLGHEGVGAVVATGEGVRGLRPGDRVVIAPRITCGRCRYCRRGLDNQCEDYRTIGTTMDGVFAPYLRAPASALYRISDAVSDDDAVFFEPLSCVVGAVQRAPVRPGDRVAIIGAGPMGALFAMMYRTLGAGTIIMLDVVPYRIEQAWALADHVINPTETDARQAVLDLTEIGCDVVVDAVGNQIDVAIGLARRVGTVLLFGLRAARPPGGEPVHDHALRPDGGRRVRRP